jgi:hypothetical protein
LEASVHGIGNIEKGKPEMKKCFVFASVGAMALSAASMADITGAYYSGSHVTAVDGFGAPDFDGWVVDLFLASDDATDTVLNVFNVNLSNSAGATSYYQSFTGATWLPNNLGAPFETDALQHADSFVSMGGRDINADSAYVDGAVVQMNANGTGLDPNFGGTSAGAPGEDAGWYNSNPEVYIGAPVDGQIFLGRFALNNGGAEFTLGGTLGVTWNNGIGTEGHQMEGIEIQAIPAPGAFALLGLASLAGRRRRN